MSWPIHFGSRWHSFHYCFCCCLNFAAFWRFQLVSCCSAFRVTHVVSHVHRTRLSKHQCFCFQFVCVNSYPSVRAERCRASLVAHTVLSFHFNEDHYHGWLICISLLICIGVQLRLPSFTCWFDLSSLWWRTTRRHRAFFLARTSAKTGQSFSSFLMKYRHRVEFRIH